MSEDNIEDEDPNEQSSQQADKVVVGDLELDFSGADVTPDDPQVKIHLDRLNDLEKDYEAMDKTGYGKKYASKAQAGANYAHTTDKLRAAGVTIKAVTTIKR